MIQANKNLTGVGIFVYTILLSVLIGCGGGSHNHEAVDTPAISSIHIALERYAVNNSEHDPVYPADIQVLKDEQYLACYPTNAYLPDRREIVHIQYGDAPSVGDFSYVPVINDAGVVYGFYLIEYGRNGDETVISSSPDLPPLDEFLD